MQNLEKVSRIYNALVKHNGKQIEPDSTKLEIDLSVLLELFALEDHIKEIEADNFNKECLIKAYEQMIEQFSSDIKGILEERDGR